MQEKEARAAGREPTLASSSLAAWIQMAISDGSARRASLRIFRAFSYDSSRASASQSSTCCKCTLFASEASHHQSDACDWSGSVKLRLHHVELYWHWCG